MEKLYSLIEIRRSYYFDNKFSAKAVIYADHKCNKLKLVLECRSCSSLFSPSFTATRFGEFEDSFPEESVWVEMMQKVEDKYGLNASILVHEKLEALFTSPDGKRHLLKIISDNLASKEVKMSYSVEAGEKITRKAKINMRDFEEVRRVAKAWLQELRKK